MLSIAQLNRLKGLTEKAAKLEKTLIGPTVVGKSNFVTNDGITVNTFGDVENQTFLYGEEEDADSVLDTLEEAVDYASALEEEDLLPMSKKNGLHNGYGKVLKNPAPVNDKFKNEEESKILRQM